jgi:phospholipid/cholesterol/gamma-HCH transport system ATP-binding protein
VAPVVVQLVSTALRTSKKSRTMLWAHALAAGDNPISSWLLDELILDLRDSLGATVVVVTHELASIFTIGNNSVFFDPEAKTMTASADPKELLAHCPDPKVRAFLRQEEKEES